MRCRPVVLALAVLGALAAPILGALGGPARARNVAPCAPQVRDGLLPVWMRDGFRPNPRNTYVLGRRGAIGGVLWGVRSLNAPPSQHRNNKILWVSRRLPTTPTALWIRLQKMDGTRRVGPPVHRILSYGPGPSFLDAPSAGCWRLTLSWSGRRDTLDLVYTPPTD